MKNYLFAIVGLVVMLVVAKFLLNIGKKAPVVGGVVGKVEELAGLE